MNPNFRNLVLKSSEDFTTVFDVKGEHENFLKNGKSAINDLLWQWLPGRVTLMQADAIANGIYDVIDRLWNEALDGNKSSKEQFGKGQLD